MAKMASISQQVLDAIAGLNVGPIHSIKRVVIDIDIDASTPTPIQLYVEHYGDEKVIKVVEALSTVDIEIVKESKSNG